MAIQTTSSRPAKKKYRDFSEMPADELRAFAEALSEAGSKAKPRDKKKVDKKESSQR